MIAPTAADVGRRVVYCDRAGYSFPEEGVITSFNERWVFVRYGTGSTSAATSRQDLEWLAPPRAVRPQSLATERYQQAWREKDRLR